MNKLKSLFRKQILWIIVIFLVTESMLLGLAFWQYKRGLYKEEIRTDVLKKFELLPEQNLALIPQNEWRHTMVEGTFDHSRTVVLEHQFYHYQPGRRVLTPLILKENKEIIVDRGWQPYPKDRLNPHLESLAPMFDHVLLEGIIRVPPKRKGVLSGPSYNTSKKSLLLLDPKAIPTFGYERLPVYFQTSRQTHPDLKAVVDLPEDGSRHRQYMVTWLVLAVLWPLLFLAAWRQRFRKEE